MSNFGIIYFEIMEKEPGIDTLIVSTHGLRRNRPDGVTNFIVQSRPYLEDRGVRVKLIGPRIPDKENNLADRTLGRRVRLNINKTHFESSFLFTGKRKARNLLLEENPDLVVIHQPLAGNVAHALMTADKENEVCFVGYFHAQAEALDTPSKLIYFGTKFLRRPTLKGLTPGFKKTINNRLDGRVAPSYATADFWNKFLPGDYEVIPNGIDTNKFTVEGPIIEEWGKDRKRIIFATGRHDEKKGFDTLLQATSILVYNYDMRDVLLKIGGKGEMTNELIALTHRLRLTDYVEFLGILPPSDLPKGYRTADVFASTVDGNEGFGLVLAEAMATGTPVVGSNVAGYNEVIGENLSFAWMTNPKDPKDVADKLKIVLSQSAEERKNRGKLAAEYVKTRFSLDINADRQVSYYDQSLKVRAAKRAEIHKKYSMPSKKDIYRKGG